MIRRVTDASEAARGSPCGQPRVLPLLLRHDFLAFAHTSLRILLGSNAPVSLLWHVEAMAHLVAEIANGKCRRAIVTVPPRHLKSTVATVAHIAWPPRQRSLRKDPSRLVFEGPREGPAREGAHHHGTSVVSSRLSGRC